ncbi:hypothetical protein M9Y10_029211 [Tritrichomonas musculus]|uniref:Uncharacterized protein n=1 Tax=Tritrichomonas musculus TaxID=1915356 RepID=A0ABR2KLI0_9EUKA
MYNQYASFKDQPVPQNVSQVSKNFDCCIFFDGISIFSQRNNDNINSFYQMMKNLFENENKEIYIHVFCKNANKSSDTCTDRIWISISYINQIYQENEVNDQQNLFVLYSGYPYSRNFFSIRNESIDYLRSVLESSSHAKIFATQEIANDAIKIFFNYFKIKIRSAVYLTTENNRWFSGLESFRNKETMIDVIRISLTKFKREDLFSQIYNYSTRFQPEDPTETDSHSDVVILLSTFHSILSCVKDKQIFLS